MKSSLFSKKTIIIFIVVVCYLLWTNNILNAFDNLLVNPFLKDVSNTSKNNFVFVFLFIITSLYFYYWYRSNRRITSGIIYFAAFILLNCLWFRFFQEGYIYTPFLNTSIFYVDYFIYLFAGILILKVLEFLKSQNEPSNPKVPFLIDKPWQPGGNDLFGRDIFAKTLADIIQSRLNEEDAGALAIGINGTWGSGKTSFLNKISNYIEPDNRIIIHFNPWRSTSPIKLLKIFLNYLLKN